SDSPACPLIREVEKAANRAADLTHQMLAYSGRGKLVLGPVDLSALVVEMAGLLKTVISKKATLCLDCPLTLPALAGDATQVRQIVMNLITNASDALGEDSGTISVRTWLEQATLADLRSPFLQDELPAGSYLGLEVADTGCGMAPETMARMFDPFYTTKFTGPALGLPP